MSRVLVIHSVHYPTGNATVGELTWLLRRIRPEVIFLEHAPSLHPRFLDRTLLTLESAAVLSHLEQHAPTLIPVDAEVDPASIKQGSDALLNRLAALSVRYKQLELLNARQTAQGGFAYLNGPYSALIQLEREHEMLATVQAAADPTPTELHHNWLALLDERETTMIRAVEESAHRSPFVKAVLLLGVAHGPSLYSRVKSRAAGSASALR